MAPGQIERPEFLDVNRELRGAYAHDHANRRDQEPFAQIPSCDADFPLMTRPDSAKPRLKGLQPPSRTRSFKTLVGGIARSRVTRHHRRHNRSGRRLCDCRDGSHCAAGFLPARSGFVCGARFRPGFHLSRSVRRTVWPQRAPEPVLKVSQPVLGARGFESLSWRDALEPPAPLFQRDGSRACPIVVHGDTSPTFPAEPRRSASPVR